MRPREQGFRFSTRRVENLRERFKKAFELVKICFAKPLPIPLRQLFCKHLNRLRPVLRSVFTAQLLLGDALAEEPIALYKRHIHRAMGGTLSILDDATHIPQEVISMPARPR